MRLSTLFTTALLSSALLASCAKNSDTTGTSNNTTTYVTPKSGSTYTAASYSTDTTTGAPVAGSQDTTHTTVVATGLSIGGKTNVVEFVDVTNSSQDTSYLVYEANNDISSVFLAPTGELVWMTLPVGSKGTTTYPFMDTTIVVQGQSMHTKISMTNKYIDQETMTVKGTALTVVKVQSTLSSSISVAGVPVSSVNQVTNMYYAPSIGYLVKSETPVSTDIDGSKQEGSVTTLIDYNVK